MLIVQAMDSQTSEPSHNNGEEFERVVRVAHATLNEVSSEKQYVSMSRETPGYRMPSLPPPPPPPSSSSAGGVDAACSDFMK